MKTFYSFFIIALACLAISCSSKKAEAEADASATETALTVDQLLADADQYVDSLITVEGVCTHTCAHGAKKIFIVGSDDSNIIRVEACELGAFNPEVVNNLVSVKGYLREDIIDDNYLNQWEERIAAKEAEGQGESKAGCESERAAHGVESESARGQIEEYRQRIAEKIQNGENPYLSFYHIDATAYEIQQ